MTEFADMIRREDYDRSNIAPSILDGRYTREQIRARIFHLNRMLDELVSGMSAWCNSQGYRRIFVPNIVSTIGACENWRTLYKVDQPSSFFHLLTQTGQLFLEGALVMTPRVWCLTKSFRKEKTEDHRHLNEFHLFEIEGAFDFAELLQQMREIYRHALERILSWPDATAKKALSIDEEALESQLASAIPDVTYTDSVRNLPGRKWGDDLSPEDERRILQRSTQNRAPVLITRFPAAIKFFNMAMEEANPSTVLSVDMVLPYSGEAAGGAQREDDHERLRERLRGSEMFQHHLTAGGTYEDFAPYVTLIEQRLTPRHSGCGLGLDRIIQSVLREDDIRLCSVDYLTKILFAWDALALGA